MRRCLSGLKHQLTLGRPLRWSEDLTIKTGEACTVLSRMPAEPNRASEFLIVITPLAGAPKTFTVDATAFDPLE